MYIYIDRHTRLRVQTSPASQDWHSRLPPQQRPASQVWRGRLHPRPNRPARQIVLDNDYMAGNNFQNIGELLAKTGLQFSWNYYAHDQRVAPDGIPVSLWPVTDLDPDPDPEE